MMQSNISTYLPLCAPFLRGAFANLGLRVRQYCPILLKKCSRPRFRRRPPGLKVVDQLVTGLRQRNRPASSTCVTPHFLDPSSDKRCSEVSG
jgi:hypothetical protein